MIQALLISLVLFCISLYAFAPHAPAAPKQIKDVSDLEGYLARLVDSGNPPSLSVIIVKNGRVVYSNAFGYADKPHNLRATPDTVYHWWFSLESILNKDKNRSTHSAVHPVLAV